MLNGLIITLLNLEKIIGIICKEYKLKTIFILMKQFKLSEKQANAILEIK
ncbi:MAG: hypothetical protein AB8V73_00960 [Coxiella endosymbiont of Dermacentor nuttalli]